MSAYLDMALSMRARLTGLALAWLDTFASAFRVPDPRDDGRSTPPCTTVEAPGRPVAARPERYGDKVARFAHATALPSVEDLKEAFGNDWSLAARRLRPVIARNRLSESQNHRCCHCGMLTSYDGPASLHPTIEHVVPRVAGGPLTFWNTAMACRKCNSARGDAYVPGEELVVSIAPADFLGSFDRTSEADMVAMIKAEIEPAVAGVIMRLPSDDLLEEVFGEHAALALDVFKQRLAATVLAARQGWSCVSCGEHLGSRPMVLGHDRVDEPGYGDEGAACPGCFKAASRPWIPGFAPRAADGTKPDGAISPGAEAWAMLAVA